MTLASPKGTSAMAAAFPRSLSSMAVSMGGLALLLVIASLFLVSYPIGSTVHEYFYGVDRSNVVSQSIVNGNSGPVNNDSPSGSDLQAVHTRPGSAKNESVNFFNKSASPSGDAENSVVSGIADKEEVEKVTVVSNNAKTEELRKVNGVSNDTKIEEAETVTAVSDDSVGANYRLHEDGQTNFSSDSGLEIKTDASTVSNSATNMSPKASECDLFNGSWFYDSLGPLYTNNSCPVITQMQNCQGNGRPDKEYENWRWKPSQCELPRFDAKKFLELMRGKTLAFIGDSVARNQMESMLCLLWQVEAPKNRGNRRMQRYYFRSTSTMIVRIWSSWLVHRTSDAIDFAPQGIDKLHLDLPDEHFMEFIPNFDVVVLSSGHWFAKQSVYVLNNEIVGGQLWWPDKSRPMQVNNIEAFGISVETILTSVATHPNYTGLTIVRSYSPDHYEGGAWNTGGSCTGKVKPLAPGELVENGFTDIMHKKQVAGFDNAVKKASNKSKLRLIDITQAFGYRHDGHPGPYRSPDPNKKTQRGPDGRPPPQDCLHWCMPGPVDTWNELVLDIIRREFESK